VSSGSSGSFGSSGSAVTLTDHDIISRLRGLLAATGSPSTGTVLALLALRDHHLLHSQVHPRGIWILELPSI
jgi:hypothetical protein